MTSNADLYVCAIAECSLNIIFLVASNKITSKIIIFETRRQELKFLYTENLFISTKTVAPLVFLQVLKLSKDTCLKKDAFCSPKGIQWKLYEPTGIPKALSLP